MIKLLRFLTWSLWLLRSVSQSGAGSSPPLVRFPCCARTPRPGPISAAQPHKVGDQGLRSLWSRKNAADEISGCFVPVCQIIYIEKKVIQSRKTPKRSIPAPLEFFQPIPLVFSLAMRALPRSHPRAAGEYDGAAQQQFCSCGCMQRLCSNHQRPGFKLRDLSGEVSKRMLAAMQGDQGLSGATLPAS